MAATASQEDGRGVFSEFVVDNLYTFVRGYTNDFGEGLDGECLD